MVVTGSQIIERALRDIKVLGIGRSLTTQHTTFCLPLLQELVELWKLKRLLMYQVQKQSYTLVASTQAYTIGPSATFAFDPKPQYLAHASCLPSGETVEQPMAIWTVTEWLNEPNPTLTDLVPRAVYMERGNLTNTLRFWPIPTTAPAVKLGLPTGINGFVDIGTSYTFPEGYAQLFRLAMAAKVARSYGKSDLIPELNMEFAAVMGTIEQINDDGPPRLAPNLALSPEGYYDITLDDYLNPR